MAESQNCELEDSQFSDRLENACFCAKIETEGPEKLLSWDAVGWLGWTSCSGARLVKFAAVFA